MDVRSLDWWAVIPWTSCCSGGGEQASGFVVTISSCISITPQIARNLCKHILLDLSTKRHVAKMWWTHFFFCIYASLVATYRVTWLVHFKYRSRIILGRRRKWNNFIVVKDKKITIRLDSKQMSAQKSKRIFLKKYFLRDFTRITIVRFTPLNGNTCIWHWYSVKISKKKYYFYLGNAAQVTFRLQEEQEEE